MWILLIGGWLVYFFLHSFLATTSIKGKILEKTRISRKHYRLIYSIWSSVALLMLLLLNGMIESSDFFHRYGYSRYLSLFVASFGVIIIRLAFKEYSLINFLGLGEEKQKLVIQGILKRVRHPIYSGTILVVIGYFMFSPNLPTLVSSLCILGYLPIGIFLEEKKLIDQFGDAYRQYQKEVPALLPKLF